MSIREEYDFKKMEGKKNPHKVGEKCECPQYSKYETGVKCGACGKPIEPKPNLPEKMEEDGGYPETALIAVINEVIDYLRVRE